MKWIVAGVGVGGGFFWAVDVLHRYLQALM